MSDDGFVGDAEPHDTAPRSACTLSYREDSEGTIAELVVGDVVIDRARRKSEDDAAAIRGGFSPDGRWIAIAKLGVQAHEVYVIEARIVASPCSP
jgi:hypothetical protein